MDIKIGAVFSLAAEEETQKTEPIKIKEEKDDLHEYIQSAAVTEFENEDEDDQWPIDQSSSPILHDENISSCVDYEWDSRTESASSDFADADCPPFLSLEPLPDEPPSADMDWQDDMLPPVLEPEKIDALVADSRKDQEKKSPVKRKCQKILPSYLALTDVGPVMKNKGAISVLQLKHVLKECSNMCKKYYFRRRLEAGKDVFNVLTPSRQRPYQLYLQKQIDRRKLLGGKLTKTKRQKNSPNLASLLAFHDKLKEEKKTSQGQKPVAKVRRRIHTTPTDFKHLQQAGNETVCQDVLNSNNAGKDHIDAAYQARMDRLIHMKELNVLKSQIRWKRISNKQLKKLRKKYNKPVINTTTLGMSSKGRQRKSSRKYDSDHFLLTKTYEAHIGIITRLNDREKKMEKEQKKKKVELQNLRRRSVQPDHISKSIDVVIDNPENDQIVKLSNPKVKVGMNIVVDETSKRITEYPNKNIGKTKRVMKKLKARNKVLIRDMPDENNVINDFLHDSSHEPVGLQPPIGTHIQTSARANTTSTTQTYSHEPYPYAKSLLKTSLLVREEQNRSGDSVDRHSRTTQGYPRLLAPDLEIEKAKQLRIPEKVQKLFQVKTEVKDNDAAYGGQTPVTTRSHVTPPVTSLSGTILSPSGPVRFVHPSVPKLNPQPKTSAQVNYIDSTSSKNKRQILPAPGIKGLKDTDSGTKHVLLKNGSVAIPVMVKSGPNGEKTMTVLPAAYPLQSKEPSLSTSISSSTVKANESSSAPVVVVTSPPHIMHHPIPSSSTVPIHQQLKLVPSPSTVPIHQHMQLEPVRLPVMGSRGVASPTVNIKDNKNSAAVRHASQVIVYPKTTNFGTPPTGASLLRGNMPMSGNRPIAPDMVPTTPSVKQAVLSSPIPLMSPIHTTSIPVTNTIGQQPENCKFYLLKVDNKSILIPMQPGQASVPPTAFVVNDSLTPLTNVTKTLSSTAAGSSAIVTLGLSSPHIQSKPTATITPSMKPQVTTTPAYFANYSQKNVVAKPTQSAATVLKVIDVIKEPLKQVPLSAYKSVSTGAKLQKSLGTNTYTETHTLVNIKKEVGSAILTDSIGAGKNQTTSNVVTTSERGLASISKLLNLGTEKDLDDRVDNSANKGHSYSGPGTYMSNSVPRVEFNNKPIKYTIQSSGKNTDKKSATTSNKDKDAREEPVKFDASDREEKLRRLKELLKEKQKAVDDLRANKPKPSD